MVVNYERKKFIQLVDNRCYEKQSWNKDRQSVLDWKNPLLCLIETEFKINPLGATTFSITTFVRTTLKRYNKIPHSALSHRQHNNKNKTINVKHSRAIKNATIATTTHMMNVCCHVEREPKMLSVIRLVSVCCITNKPYKAEYNYAINTMLCWNKAHNDQCH